MKILFIKNIQEAQYIVDNNFHLKNLNCIVTEDMAAAYFLEKEKINFIDILDELSQQKIKENINIAYLNSYKITDYLSKNSRYRENFKFTNVSQDLVYAFQIIENAKFFFNSLAKKFKISEFTTFESKKVGLIRTGPKPAKVSASCITESVLLQACTNLKINIRFLKFRIHNEQTKQNKTFLLSNKKRHSNFLDKAKNKTILLHRDSLSFEEFNKIHYILKTLGKFHVITVSNDLIQKLNPRSSKIEIKKLLNEIIKAFASLGDPILINNTFMSFQFECIAKEIYDADTLSINLSHFFSSFNIDLFILGHDAFTKERALVNSAREFCIESLSFFHGGAGSIFGARGVVGISNNVLLWNEADLNCMRYYNYQNRFTITGPLKRLKKGRAKSGSNNNFLLLTTAISTGLAAPLTYPSAHRKSLTKIIELLNYSKPTNLRIKSHPNYDYDQLYFILSNNNTKISYDRHVDLESSAQNIGIVIMLNYYSTAALYFYKIGIPVIYINEGVFTNKEWMNTYDIFYPKTITLNKTSDLIEEVKKLENPSYRKKIILEQRKLLNKIMPFSERITQKKILNVISDTFIREAKKIKKYSLVDKHSSINLMSYIAGIKHNSELKKLNMKFFLKNTNLYMRGFLSNPTSFFSLLKLYFVALLTLNKIEMDTHKEIFQFLLMKHPKIFNFRVMQILLTKIFRVSIKNEHNI